MSGPESRTITLQLPSEIEADLVRHLLNDHDVETFHVPSEATALLGRMVGFRFAIREIDLSKAEAALASYGLRFDDLRSVRSAYNLDEPFHHLFSSRNIFKILGLLILMALVLFSILIPFCTRPPGH